MVLAHNPDDSNGRGCDAGGRVSKDESICCYGEHKRGHVAMEWCEYIHSQMLPGHLPFLRGSARINIHKAV